VKDSSCLAFFFASSKRDFSSLPSVLLESFPELLAGHDLSLVVGGAVFFPFPVTEEPSFLFGCNLRKPLFFHVFN